MKWHTKTIIRKSFALVVSILLFMLMFALFIASLSDGQYSGSVFFALLSVFMIIAIYSQYAQLLEALEKKSSAASKNLLADLRQINPYVTPADLLAAFNEQKNNALYQDKKITITNTFIQNNKTGKIFIIDGILDAVSFTQKTNGLIDYVSLLFLYYDGNRYEIKYKRPLGFSDMKEHINNTSLMANIIAQKSTNFRKYPEYRFE